MLLWVVVAVAALLSWLFVFMRALAASLGTGQLRVLYSVLFMALDD